MHLPCHFMNPKKAHDGGEIQYAGASNVRHITDKQQRKEENHNQGKEGRNLRLGKRKGYVTNFPGLIVAQPTVDNERSKSQ